MTVEIELKFYIPKASLDLLRKKIVSLCSDSEGKVFETNLLFDNSSKSIRARKAILRLRCDTRSILCYKEPLNLGKVSKDFKVKEEIEFEVDDFESARNFLGKLGFFEFMKYEKRRENFRLRNLKISIDEMPIGMFLEIEGNEEDIRCTAQQLGLDWKQRIKRSYEEIFSDLKRQANISFRDLTFKNFEKIDPKDINLENLINNCQKEK